MLLPVLVGIGSNLPCPPHDTPLAVCEAALEALSAEGWRVVARSRWYESAPVPVSDQPWFCNGVVSLAGVPAPAELLGRLHAIEARFRRLRGQVNAARTLDLDLLAYRDVLSDGAGGGPVLPHPRLHQRAFVVLPLAEVAPGWRHPRLGRSVEDLAAGLPPDQAIRPAGS